MGEAALVLSDQKPPAHKPKYQRSTEDRFIAVHRLSKLGHDQEAIAQIVGCDQSTVSRILKAFDDTTTEATAYARGQALPMMKKIVGKGRPSDLIKALQGVGVLHEERGSGLVVQIGIKDSDVSISLSPGESSTLERRSTETLRIQAGSDNQSSVNE